MKTISKAAFIAATLFAVSTVLGQTKPATPAVTVLIGTATANDAYTSSQKSSLEAMRKAITVTNMPATELQKMKDLAP